jgi:hypothetical protein
MKMIRDGIRKGSFLLPFNFGFISVLMDPAPEFAEICYFSLLLGFSG